MTPGQSKGRFSATKHRRDGTGQFKTTPNTFEIFVRTILWGQIGLRLCVEVKCGQVELAYLLRPRPESYNQECERVLTKFAEAIQLAQQGFVEVFSAMVSHFGAPGHIMLRSDAASFVRVSDA